jgi:amino acid transporter
VFAELGSQFRDAGGPYLYARTALGRLAGIQVGWFLWMMRLTAAAGVVDVFVVYLGEFWAGATAPVTRAAIMTGLIGGLALVNYRGLSAGAGVSNVVTVAKLTTLGLFVVGGIALCPGITPGGPAIAPSGATWLEALVLLVYAFGGFEAALIPAGETKDPRRDLPFALLTGLAVVTVIYLAIHYVAMMTLPDLARSQRPLADAARVFAGPGAASAITIGVLLSIFGWLAVQLLSAPRLTFALAERGDFPAVFARVHPRFRTPHVSIVVWALLALALAIYGNFIWNAVLSVAARLVTYMAACCSLIALRRQRPEADAWRAPAGIGLAAVGLGFCALLISRLAGQHVLIIAVVASIASVNWLVVRRRKET